MNNCVSGWVILMTDPKKKSAAKINLDW